MSSAPDPFAPARLGPIELRNRIVKSATNEGMAREGRVTPELIEFHRRPSRGGVGMSTLAYVSASPEGRTFRDQLVFDEATVPGLAELVEAVHAEGAAAQVQLGHAGWFANPAATKQQAVGPSRLPNPHTFKMTAAATQADLDRLLRDFEKAGHLAARAGFDSIEVHLGHGYLLSQFLSPFTNRRRDRFGGSIAERAEFPRRAVEAVRSGIGTDRAVTVKLNMEDGFRGGLTVAESIQVAKWLKADGTIDAIQLTGGFTARTPMFLMRGEPIIPALAELEHDRVRRFALKAAGRVLREKEPFTEAFFRDTALEFLDVGLPLMLLGGITKRATIEQAMVDGFHFVVMGRALIRNPDLVNRMSAGQTEASDCIPCNGCVIEMEKGGARCIQIPDDGLRPATTYR